MNDDVVEGLSLPGGALQCAHKGSVKISDAQWVYGTPGIIPARYRCADCPYEWDRFEEPPKTVAYKLERP